MQVTALSAANATATGPGFPDTSVQPRQAKANGRPNTFASLASAHFMFMLRSF
jgi:hypothetical protein